MYREQLQFNRQPFQDTIDTAFFFSGGKRREVVDEIKKSLSQSVSLMVLTGDEGSGKTMVCRMVEKELPVGMTSVFLPKTIESYDDMVRIVAQEINVESVSNEKPLDNKTLLQEIVKNLQERDQRLVVIFDEAEKIFLATLERIRKLLDQVNEENICFQILLSGGQQLRENLQQLSIVSFQKIEERYFELEPLGKDATWAYVNYCVKVATGKTMEFFSHEIASKITTGTAGNLSKINNLSLEYLCAEKLDSSFLSLLDDIKDGSGKSQKKKQPKKRSRVSSGGLDSTPDYLNFSKIVPRWVYYGGGVCVVLLLSVFLVVRSGDNKAAKNDDSQEVPVIVLKEVEPLAPLSDSEKDEKTTLVEQIDRGEDKVVADPESSEQKAAMEGKSPLAVVEEAVEEKKIPESVPREKETEQVSIVTIVDEPPKAALPEVNVEPKKDKESIGTDFGTIVEKSTEKADKTFSKLVTAKTIFEPVVVSEDSRLNPEPTKEQLTEQKQSPVVAEPVIEEEVVASAQEVKQSPVAVEPVIEEGVVASAQEVKKSRPLEPVKILKDGLKKKPLEESSEKTAVQIASVGLEQLPLDRSDEDALFRARLAAGARWLVGGGGNKYTVQLMVLTSEKAEENLKNMLKTPEYQEIADHLYVLRRIGVISTVMVFYGEYPSLTAARNARNNLPVFLRKHHPYSISIHGAVEKANAL